MRYLRIVCVSCDVYVRRFRFMCNFYVILARLYVYHDRCICNLFVCLFVCLLVSSISFIDDTMI